MLVYMALIEDEREKLHFEELYHKYYRLMFRIAGDILNNQQDTEDAVSEAFFSIAQNFSKISSMNTHKIKAYFVIVVERKAIDIYRKKQAHTVVPFDEHFEGAASLSMGEGAAAEAMNRLPPRYRELLYLKHFCGFKSAEIARMLGMSDSMVRRTLSDARAAYRAELEKEGIEA
ncbi:MAG: sigma-70 family RNA polymerase sigma factor [Oscillospiraceae bacterium]|nr:sigma-70 family RNA polymerase sigma factor [Oscillospiraceae bacterium]